VAPRRHQLDEALVARQLGEFGAQVAAGMVEIEAFELAEAERVEEDREGHHLRQGQLRLAPPLFGVGPEHPPVPAGREPAAKIVNQAKRFGQRVHGCLPLGL